MLLRFILCVLLASQVGTQVAAWRFHHHPVLGARLRVRPQPLYPPTGLYVWTLGVWRVLGRQCVTDPRLKMAWSAWGGVLIAGMVLGTSSQRPRPRPVDRLATRRVFRRLHLFGRHGVVLGRTRWRGRVLRDNSPTHVLIVGPTRSGKGEGVVVPTLLGGWRADVLVYDPKGELAAMTAAYRATFSTVLRCDPTSLTTHGCNLLASVQVNSPTEHRDSARLMARLTDPDGTAAARETPTARHFRELTTAIGQALLLYGLRCNYTTLPAIAHVLHVTPIADLTAQLATQPHPVIQSAANSLAVMDGGQLAGLLTTLKRAFDPFLDPGVARLTSRTDFALPTLRQAAQPLSLYYGVPFGDQEQLRSVTRLWFHSVFDAALASLTAWRRRLLILLDEVTTLRQFPLLVDGFDFAAGYGIKLCILTTSLRRLESVYGTHQNFEEGSAYRLFFPPNTRHMAQRIASETGEQLGTRIRTSRQTGLSAQRQHTVSVDEQPESLLSATGIAQLGQHHVLLLGGDQITARLRKIRAWKERPWRHRRTPLPLQNPVCALPRPWGDGTAAEAPPAVFLAASASSAQEKEQTT